MDPESSGECLLTKKADLPKLRDEIGIGFKLK